MKKVINWSGLCLLFMVVQAAANEVIIQDIWMRASIAGKDKVMVGMMVKSESHARIVSVISPAYSSVQIYGPGYDGKKLREIEYITLPAQKPVVLASDGIHLLLSDSKRQGMIDKIPLIISVQFEDKSQKNYTVLAQSEDARGAGSTGASVSGATIMQPGAVPILSASGAPMENGKVDAGTSVNKASAVNAHGAVKQTVFEKKSSLEKERKVAKTSPVPRVMNGKVAAQAETALNPVSATSITDQKTILPNITEADSEAHKKELVARAEEKTRQEESKSKAECLNLAIEIRECDKSNDMVQEWCVNNAKANSSCKLPLDQVKSLR